MFLLAGLGNPGEKYSTTRHNVGFMFLDWLAQGKNEQWKFDTYTNAEILKNGDLKTTNYDLQTLLVKPQTHMNRSGESVKRLTTNYKLPTRNLCVVHDDLDIELGKYKIQFGVGPKKHNGIASIEQQLGTSDFWRIRIGVDDRRGDRTLTGEAYVLQNFKNSEIEVVNNTFPTIVTALENAFSSM